MRLVMRIAAICVDCDNRQVFRDQVLATKSLGNPLLDLVFRGPAITGPAPDLLKCGRDDGVNRVARGKVALDLFVTPRSFKARHQVSRTGDLLAEATHQFDGARV